MKLDFVLLNPKKKIPSHFRVLNLFSFTDPQQLYLVPVQNPAFQINLLPLCSKILTLPELKDSYCLAWWTPTRLDMDDGKATYYY
jgi:hypothetical protein